MTYAENFSSEEFRSWADDMSPRLVTMMDILRFQIGSAIIISPADGALGRNLGYNDLSQHNIDRWGKVLAADFFVPHVETRGAVEDVVDRMRKIGFTGIGVYSDTQFHGRPLPMFHGDVRADRLMGDPATWGRINGKYVSLMAAVQSLPLGGKP